MTSIIRQVEQKPTDLQQIVSHLPGVIYQSLLHPDGCNEYLYLSPSCRQIYEREPDEIQYNSALMWGWIDDREQQEFIQSLLTSAQNLSPWQRQWQYQTPSGKIKYLSAIAQPVPQNNGDIIWDGLIIEIMPPSPHYDCCHYHPTCEIEPLKMDEIEQVLSWLETSDDSIKRQKTELALQESQTRFKRLAENVPGVTYQYHQYNHQGQGCFTYLSPKCLELTEIRPEVILKNADFLWKLIHPDDLNAFVDSMAEAVDTGKPWQHQYRLITPSGKIKWIQAGGSLGKQADGSIVWDGLLLDISDRKQAEEAWQRSETQLRELAERESILNCIANLIRNSLDWNKILETTVEEIRQLLGIDRCYFAGYHSELNPPEWEILKESKASNLVSISELYPGDALHPISEIVLQGNIIQIDQVIACKIPAIRNFLMVLELESVLIFPLQIQSGDIGALVLANCQEPRPWKPQEVELLQSVINQLEIAINQAKLYTESQESARIATAKTKELEQTLTQLQQAQIQLVQSEKMSSLGQMVAGIAHEINNPVSFIFGNLTYAQEYLDDLFSVIEVYQKYYPHPDPNLEEILAEFELDFIAEDLPRLFNSMKTGAERIRDIVKSLRIFSRLDESELKDIDLHETLDSTLMLLESRLKEQPRHPAIQVIKQYGNLPRIECYAGELNQVLMNLLTNAIDAIEHRNKGRSLEDIVADSGMIWITTLLTDGQQVQIRIADNGIGMKAEVLAKIFDPFFTTKDVGLGTGLGLSTSYKIIVEKHGGQLSCISEVGLGTEFVIQIPKQQPITD
ncbi:Multi-sensor signal transduction histidine kinase (fragment) [Planktothrix serta PCC 8927]|uniref:histidine kinase n=1 Tax=Planktothrix serta PCC 8927 TaxID=671068 RepID=A0A7Z9BJA4_9CYAN